MAAWTGCKTKLDNLIVNFLFKDRECQLLRRGSNSLVEFKSSELFAYFCVAKVHGLKMVDLVAEDLVPPRRRVSCHGWNTVQC